MCDWRKDNIDVTWVDFCCQYLLSHEMSDVDYNLPGTLKSQIFNLCI